MRCGEARLRQAVTPRPSRALDREALGKRHSVLVISALDRAKARRSMLPSGGGQWLASNTVARSASARPPLPADHARGQKEGGGCALQRPAGSDAAREARSETREPSGCEKSVSVLLKNREAQPLWLLGDAPRPPKPAIENKGISTRIPGRPFHSGILAWMRPDLEARTSRAQVAANLHAAGLKGQQKPFLPPASRPAFFLPGFISSYLPI